VRPPPPQDSQPGDYVFYGTPLQSEEAESKRQHEFQKRDVKDAAGVKALPVWQQARRPVTKCAAL